MGTSTDALLGWGVAFSTEISDQGDVLYGLNDELAAMGVVVEMHQSCDYAKPCVFIAESFKRANRGDVVDVTPREPGADWGEKIAAALRFLAERVGDKVLDDEGEAYSFATEQAPGWKLVSWWA